MQCLLSVLPYQAANAQALDSDFYAIGSPGVTDYYVDPTNGSDSNDGLSRTNPRQTVTSIWNSIPANSTLSNGFRINLLPGTYTSDHLPNYWENRVGTSSNPLILQALDGYGTVRLSRDINMAGVSYFYLLGVEIQNQLGSGYGDAFHCERCSYVLLRGNSFNGAPNGRNAGGDIAYETVKFNQSDHIYLENNNIQGAYDNGIDFVAVQYGHIRANRIHDTASWCAYVKGGSSYITIEGNLAYDCGEGGITAGQGAGFEFMVNPWLRFEANYVKIVNNIIYNVEGAALGVNGGYGILVAHNTAFRVGSRSHLLEVVFGERSCDGDTAACTVRQSLGGWGPSAPGGAPQPIGNADVIIANNVLYNPASMQSGFQHFAIYGPRTPTVGGIPSPQRADTGLIITGNVIWNGSASMPIGIEDSSQGCQSSNTTCNLVQITGDNSINLFEPDFIAATTGDFRPVQGGTLESTPSRTISDHGALDTSLNPILEGVGTNTMVREFSGATASTRPPGALVSFQSSTAFASAGGTVPNAGNNSNAPTVTLNKVTATRRGRRAQVKLKVQAADSDGIASVRAICSVGGSAVQTFSLRQKGTGYVGKALVSTRSKRLVIRVEAVDATGETGSVTRTVRVRS